MALKEGRKKIKKIIQHMALEAGGQTLRHGVIVLR